jgi:hypothetical protein
MRDLRHDARGVPLLLLTLWCAAATAAVTATTVSSSTTAGRKVPGNLPDLMQSS